MDQNDRSNKKIIRSLFNNYLGTVFLSELAFSVCTVIDGVLSGQYLGERALAAIGLCSPFPSILAAFSGILSAGCQSKCSYYMGRGEKENANRVFSTVVCVSMIFSILITVIFIFFAEPIAYAFGASKKTADLLPYTTDYLISCSIGTVGMIMYTILCPIVQLEGKHSYVKGATIVLAGLNIAGDLANMFIFKGGLFGVGLVTALSNIASCAVLAVALFSADADVSFAFSPGLIDIKVLPELLHKGSPKAVRRCANAMRPIFMNRLIMAAAGSAGVAALSVQGNLRAFSGTLGAGIAGTMLVIAGVVNAENDFASLAQLLKECVRKILILVVPFSILLIVSAPVIVGFYMPERSEATEMAEKAVRSYSLALPFVAFNEMYINYFQGTGRPGASSTLSVLSRIGMIVPCGLLLYFLFGANGVWAALFISEAALSLCIGCFSLVKGKGRSISEKLLFIDHSIYDNTVFFDDVISEKDKADGISERIGIFCTENGIDKRHSFLTSLFCEELVSNIIKYGFGDNKPHNIDLRISVSGEEIRIRIRDDCKPFDPKKWYDINHTDDPAANVGIKIVLKMSKKFEYTTTFRMNNVVIVI